MKSKMQYQLYFIVSILLTFFVSINAIASKPICKTTSGGSNLIQYEGKVSKIYVNRNNIILLYFDVPLTVSEAADCGFTITNGGAASFNLDDNPEFAKLFYSTALAAQASNRNVTIQMYEVMSGYMKFDRIWLVE